MSDSNLPQAGDLAISPAKKRHGCLTAWLVLMVIADVFAAIAGFAMSAFAPAAVAKTGPPWAMPAMGVLCLLQLVCVIGLFMWKKWGFYGLVVLGVASAVINSIEGRWVSGVVGAIVGLAILYLVLQIGKDDKGWPQLD